ncbi:restriction endonuclease subunit S [Acinetobacter sp. YH12099]|uniref:restriction endonuclease subunit S n=1 Tax=Acinetobacter sp. YH12099 TaxID=2601088 RepID=UPI0015D2B856|nr:restriction endonuclease subunit S [Acinetobacter sp. YH12099]
MAKYQKYVEYKDSGVRWLGAVPSHWIIAGFKKYLESTVDYRGKTPEKMDEGVFLVTARNIKNGIIDYSLSQEYVAFKDYDEIMSRGIPVLGDVLFTTEAPLGEVAQIDNVNIALAQRIIKFRGKKDILDNTYLKYFILSQEFQDSLMTFATGSTALGIKAERIGYLQQCIPPIHEQTQIANFLHHETTKIDHLIEKQQQLIELLKEKRQAVISHAVTKGLNPNVPMKDSGVEWLGEVPEHWKIMKLGIAVFMQEGPGLRTWQFTDSGTRVICVTNITEDGINFSKLEKFISTSEYIQSYQHFTVKKGDVLLSSSGNSWGKIATYDDDELVILNTSTIRLNELPIKIIDQNYIRHILSSISTREQLGLMMTGSCQPNFGPSHLKEVKVMVPPIHEQTKIINAIQEIIVKFDNLINKADKQISLMQERRTALISAAVTGKIDVRNWQAPTVAEADTEFSA